MEDIKEKKSEIREDVLRKVERISKKELLKRGEELEKRLFEFANFMESNVALLYLNRAGEINTDSIIKRCLKQNMVVGLPAFDTQKHTMKLMKLDNPDTNLIPGPRDILEPDPGKCKVLPVDCIDIAIIPGVAFDEKGGRIGSGEGYYDRFIPNLPITTRKVALILEDQMVQQIPMESHDKHVDIIISDTRIIYKI
jgi:5-formyltetrahydrofolate cyclo-ligase